MYLSEDHWPKLHLGQTWQIAACRRCITAGGPDKEQGASLKTNQEDVGEANRSEETTNLPGSLLPEYILAKKCTCHQEGPSKIIGRDILETLPSTLSLMAEQSSWVPLHCSFMPGSPFPNESFALSALMSPPEKTPFLGPGRGPSSCNKFSINVCVKFSLFWGKSLSSPLAPHLVSRRNRLCGFLVWWIWGCKDIKERQIYLLKKKM